jgi:hypothetical protein
MKMFFRIAGCALGLLLAAGPLQAQLLWPGTTAGMKMEEVQKIFPEAHAPAEPEELPAGRGTELLEMDQVVIADFPFRVGFFFKDGQLVMVALADTGEILMKDFEKFRALLRAKYGLEYSTTSSETLALKWKAVQTVILLTWVPHGHGFASLSITYEAPIPKETDRL